MCVCVCVSVWVFTTIFLYANSHLFSDNSTLPVRGSGGSAVSGAPLGAAPLARCDPATAPRAAAATPRLALAGLSLAAVPNDSGDGGGRGGSDRGGPRPRPRSGGGSGGGDRSVRLVADARVFVLRVRAVSFVGTVRRRVPRGPVLAAAQPFGTNRGLLFFLTFAFFCLSFFFSLF